MEKITAMVRFWYSTEIEIEVDNIEDEDSNYDKVADLASNFKVWDGNNSYTVEFDDLEIEF